MDFDKHENIETVIYDMQGSVIERHEGRATINPKDYDDKLPIRIVVTRKTNEVLQSYTIEKK